MITLVKAAEISKVRLDTLHPEFQLRAYGWYKECTEAGIFLMVVEGMRTPARQTELFQMGRTTPGNPCRHHGVTRQVGTCHDHPFGLCTTNALAGQSFHQYGRAFDWVPLAKHLKVDGMWEADWDNDPIYAVGADIGRRSHQFRSLSWETGHLEDATFKDWHELAQKYGSK